MIQGNVSATDEALLDLVVFSRRGQATPIRAVIDTGFTGYLTLPPTLIRELELRRAGEVMVELANGRLVKCLVYRTLVLWDGKKFDIPVDAADTDPLVGMAIMKGYDLRMQVKPGGRVILKSLR